MIMKITEYNVNAKCSRDLCAAFVADTHDILYDNIVSEIKKRNVDMILMTGDIIFGHDDHVVNGFEMLSAFVSLAPTFMCLGNHEGGAAELVRNECKGRGVHLLEQRSIDFEGIHIGGLTSGYIADNVGHSTSRRNCHIFSKIRGFSAVNYHRTRNKILRVIVHINNIIR